MSLIWESYQWDTSSLCDITKGTAAVFFRADVLGASKMNVLFYFLASLPTGWRPIPLEKIMKVEFYWVLFVCALPDGLNATFLLGYLKALPTTFDLKVGLCG